MAKDLDRSSFEALYPFEPHYARINGFDMHYLDEGRGEPVVMLHGNPTWSFYFRELIQALAPNFRTIVPDHLGCGLSETPPPSLYGYRLEDRVADFTDLLDTLGLTENLTLVLHDWGGMIGMAYAVERPDRIRRMVLFNTAAFPLPSGKRLPRRLALIRNTGPLAALAVQGANLFARGALWMAARQPLAPAVKTGLTAPYNSWRNRTATLKFVRDIPLNASDASFQRVAETGRQLVRLRDVPVLICWGEHDFVFDVEFLHEWRRIFPHAEVTTFADAGHYALEDVPHKIVPLVKDFLSRQPTP